MAMFAPGFILAFSVWEPMLKASKWQRPNGYSLLFEECW
jgi:hypothetical protein